MNRWLFAAALCVLGCPERPARLAGTFATVTETFAQRSVAQPLDLLFVVDNSKSMAPAQQRLGESLGGFFAWLDSAGVDYHVAVTSTDAVGMLGSRPAARGEFSRLGGQALVRRDTPSAVAVLAANVNLGIDGTNTEQGLFTAMQALGLVKSQRGQVPPGNVGFLRPEARLGLIFVTDEDDSSPVAWEELAFALRDLKGLGNHDAVFIGAVLYDAGDINPEYKPAHPERKAPRGCTTASSDQATSYALIQLVLEAPFPATMASICGDFSPSLRRMAIEAAGFQTRFRLAQQADPALEVDCDVRGPFCVRVDGKAIHPSLYDFDVAANQLVFERDYVPPLGAVLTVDFGVITRFGRQEDAELGAFSACSTADDCPVGVACASGKCVLKCSDPAHCQGGFTCSETGACRCQADASCGENEICAPSGACQPRARCTNSRACGSAEFCEPVTGQCRPIGTCVIPPDVNSQATLAALSCPRGHVCASGTCRPGCVNDLQCGPGQTCRFSAGAETGTCAAGCDVNQACCNGQVCNAVTGKCEAAAGVTNGTSSLALCDQASCQNGVCTGAGGQCGALFDADFGCIPSCTADSECAKGYACRFAVVVTSSNRCTLGGPSCSGGRTCSASLESPQGVCSCGGDSDCPSSATCFTYASDERYCRSRLGACFPQYECGQLRSGERLVCNDSF